MGGALPAQRGAAIRVKRERGWDLGLFLGDPSEDLVWLGTRRLYPQPRRSPPSLPIDPRAGRACPGNSCRCLVESWGSGSSYSAEQGPASGWGGG